MRSKIQKLLPFGRKFSSGSRAIIANTGWLFADRILRMGVELFVGIWIARYLGAQQYGLLNYATAFVALVHPVAHLGLNNIVVRYLVHQSWSKEQILGTTFWLKLLGGFVSLLVAFSCISFLRQDDKLTVQLVAILAMAGIFQAFDTIDLWFQSQVKSKYTVLAKNTVKAFITLLQIFLIVRQAPLIVFAWVKSLEIGLAGVGLMIAYNIKGYSLRLWRWSLPLAKTLIKESWPLILSGLNVMIYMKIDQIMLGQMINDRSVGIYSAATRISEAWYFIPSAIHSSVSPSIFEAKEISEALYYKRIGKLLRFLVLISIIIAVPMTFLSGTLITMLFGNAYAAAGPVLAIHIWAALFAFMGLGTSSWFVAEGLTQLNLRRNVLGAITNILLNLFLIPIYAELGAAIATVISYAIGWFLANATHKKTRKLFQIQLKSLLFLN